MRKITVILMILSVLLSLFGCQRPETDVVNQSLVKDTSETAPETVKTETTVTPENTQQPEPVPEPVTELEFEEFRFNLSHSSLVRIQVPESQIFTSVGDVDKHRELYENFYTSGPLNRGFDRTVSDALESEDAYFTEQLFEKKDILFVVYQPTRSSCKYEVTKVYSDGEVNIDITEYWKGKSLYNYRYKIFIIEVPKGSVKNTPTVKTASKKASDDTYIDFESKFVNIDSPRFIEGPFPDFEVVGSVQELNDHMNKYYGLFDGKYFYGSDLSKYTEEYFKKYVIAIKTFVGSSSVDHGVTAVTDMGGIIYYSSSDNIISCDINAVAIVAEVEKALLKGELHFKQELK